MSDSISGDRLYRRPGAERCYDDPATVWESEIDGQDDGDGPWEIEVWTIAPQRRHLPTASRLAEWISEWAADNSEVDEGWSEHLDDVAMRPDVQAAAVALLDLMASKIIYQMTDRQESTMTVTLDAADEPLLDGQPLYMKREAPDV